MKVLTANDAENMMRLLRGVVRQISAETVLLDAEQARLDERRSETLGPLEQQRTEISKAVLDWVAGERWPADARSKALAHGAVGMRRTPGRLVFVKGESHTLSVARLRGQEQIILKTEALDKAALRRLDPREQLLLGVRIESCEVAFLKLPEGESFSAEPEGGEA